LGYTDAVPSQLPGCPAYLSKPITVNRISPELKRESAENAALVAAIDASILTHRDHTEKLSVNTIEELYNKTKDTTKNWMCRMNDKSVNYYFIRDDPPSPSELLGHIKIRYVRFTSTSVS
jgi:hypothetical protein